MSVNDLVLAEARNWIGTPYHHRACIKGVGVDCAWLLIGVCREIGGILPPNFDPGEYTADWALHRNEERFLDLVRKYTVEVRDPVPGAIALYRNGRCIGHGAIVEQWPTIIHASSDLGMVGRDDASLGKFPRRLFGFYTAVRT